MLLTILVSLTSLTGHALRCPTPATFLHRSPVPVCVAVPPLGDAPRMAERARGPKLQRSAAAEAVLEKLLMLPTSRNAPVDVSGLGRVVRASDATLQGKLLLQVLLGLKQERRWELALALAAMVEANHQETRGDVWYDEQVEERTISADVDDDNDDDAQFRKMVAQSPNFAGGKFAEALAPTAAKEEGVEEEEVVGVEMALAATDEVVVVEDKAEAKTEAEAEAAPHPMAALLGLEARGMPPADEGSQAKLPVETIHYNVLLATCASSRRWFEAQDLMQRMKQRGVPRDTITYNSALHALDRGRRSKLALKLFKEMRHDGVPPNTVTFATVIAACGHVGEWEQALSLLDMAFATNTPRNTIVYTAAISACEKAGQWEHALELLRRMDGDGIEVDTYVLNAIVSACARAGQVEEAERVLRHEYTKRGVEPDTVSYNALLAALARAQPLAPSAIGASSATTESSGVGGAAAQAGLQGQARGDQMQAMREVLVEMRSLGLEPDVVSYNTLANAMSRAANGEGGRAVLKQMRSSGVRPDAVTYTSVIASSVDDWRAAVGLIEEMEEAPGVEVGPQAYSHTLAALSRAGEWQRACDLVRTMCEADLLPTPTAVNLMLATCAEAADTSAEGVATAASSTDATSLAAASSSAAASALAELDLVLTLAARGAARSVGSLPHDTPHTPPVDRSTVPLVRRLLSHSPLPSAAEEEALIATVEKASLRLVRSKPSGQWGRGQGRGARGAGGRRGRGRGRGGARRPFAEQRHVDRRGVREFF